MGTLLGIGRLPGDTQRARRNAQQLSSNIDEIFGTGLVIDSQGRISVDDTIFVPYTGATANVNLGTTYTLTANRLISNVATGTQPLGVTSTTKVDNLNADQVDGLHASSFVPTSVMTTLGDIIYGATSGVATRLAGNITATQKFLAQTGDGANSAAPTWEAVSLTGYVPYTGASATLDLGIQALEAGATKLGDGGTTNYINFSATGDLTFLGSAGLYPRRISQSAAPASGTGSTQIDTGELMLWRDSDDDKVYIGYNDTNAGITLLSAPEDHVDNSTVEVSSGLIRVKDLGVTGAKVAATTLTEAKMVAAATQTMTDGATITHDHARVVRLSMAVDEVTYTASTTTTIQAGSVVGQKLTIVGSSFPSADSYIVIPTGGGSNAVLSGQITMNYAGMWIEVEWDGTYWNERARDLSRNSNVNSGELSVSLGGYSNDNTQLLSTSVGGQNCTNSGASSINVGGSSVTNSNDDCASVGGSGVTNSGSRSASLGGLGNVNSGSYCASLGGANGKASLYGQLAHASGAFNSAGDAEGFEVVLRRATTNATPAELFLDGSSLRMTVPAKTTWDFDIHVSAYNDTDSIGAGWDFNGTIRRNGAGGTTLVGAVAAGTPRLEVGMATCTCVVTADDTNEALIITVTGIAAKNIRWVAIVEAAQSSYGTP